MAWTEQEISNLASQRDRYRQWLADLEAGKPPICTHRVNGVVVDSRADDISRYRRKIEELDQI